MYPSYQGALCTLYPYDERSLAHLYWQQRGELEAARVCKPFIAGHDAPYRQDSRLSNWQPG